jgi:hypothetical protein
MSAKIRVKVWSGNSEQGSGLGTLEGYVTVFFVRLPGGRLVPLPNPETRPTEAEVAYINGQGSRLVEWPGNPRIRLDSGQVVYGHVVHWAPLAEGPGPRSSEMAAT